MDEVLKNQDAFAEKMATVNTEFVPEVVDFAESFNILGVDLNLTPSVKDFRTNFPLFLIPGLSGVVQLAMTIYMQWHQKRKRRNEDMPGMGGMNAMLYIMPIFSVWLAFTVPAGVGFYWLINSLLSLFTTLGLYAYLNPKRMVKINEKEKQKQQHIL